MTSLRFLSRTALAASASLIPLGAQTPLFNDGTALGGSKVFSEGLNPLGNPARYVQSPSGWYLTYLDGDQRAKNNTSILEDTTSTSTATVTTALQDLKESPWALRTKAYGIAGVKDGMNFGFTREEYRSLYAHTDLASSRLGSGLTNNTTYADVRRTIVNRIHFGGGALAQGTAAGFNVRVERWQSGTITPYLNQVAGVYTPRTGGSFPFASLENQAMGYSNTSRSTLNFALDLGFTTELATGVRFGATVDQLNAKRLWDVTMKPQYRAALQMDLGTSTQVTVESDVNAVQRMPFPEKQQVGAVSLRYQLSSSVIFLVGGERRKIADSSVTRAGATLQLRTSSFLLGVGFQIGQDRPLKGGTLMMN